LSWLTDLASSFGIPVVAVTIAGSIYLALSKAEEVARPEALAEITAVLKNPSWSRSVKPWSIVERLFVWTFGERHFSLKCISRSAIATIIMVTSLMIFHIIYTGDLIFVADPEGTTFGFLVPFVVFAVSSSFVPDYVALLKTRAFIRITHRIPSVLILGLDAVSSIAISNILTISLLLIFFDKDYYMVKGLIHRERTAWSVILSRISDLSSPVHELWTITGKNPYSTQTVYSTYYFSTLFTSVWLALIVLSSTLIKFLAPLQRFTAWFFDVEKHPLQAVGIVTGALVMVGAAIGAVVQRL
jgi:hypothetical protein